jgi:hypothetical protein
VTYVPLGLFRALLGNQEGAVMLEDNKISIQTEPVELANPFVSCETLEEAEQIAGFSLELPDQFPGWIQQTAIRAMDSAMIEVMYEGQDRELVFERVPAARISAEITMSTTAGKPSQWMAAGSWSGGRTARQRLQSGHGTVILMP